MSTLILKRIRSHLALAVLLMCLPFLGSIIAVALTEERGYAGLGLFLALPVAQLIFAFLFLRAGALINLVSAALVTPAAYFAALFAVEASYLRIVHDFYGVFDFLIAHLLVSVMLWECVHFSISRLRSGH